MGRVSPSTLLVLASLGSVASALRSRLAAQDADHCACKNWKQLYKSELVRCGSAAEFYQTTKATALTTPQVDYLWQHLGEQFCTKFFQALDDDACVNVDMAEDRGQWCYVDSACSDLGGGEQVNGQVSWKNCSAQKDKMLRQYDPEDLQRLALANNLEMGLLNKMSYPMAPYRWKYVSAFWDADLDYLNFVPATLPGVTVETIKDGLKPRWGKRHREIDAEMTQDLQRIMDSGIPTTFDTAKDQHPPHVIVKGKSVWIVLPTAQATVVCLTGCKH